MSQKQIHNLKAKIEVHLTSKLTVTKNYQKFIFVICAVSYFFATLIKFIPYFVFMNPIFICQGIETEEVTACSKL